MSRIGKLPINIPSGVDVNINGTAVTVKGKLGEMSQEIDPCITISIDNGVMTFVRESEAPSHRSKHGLYRALIQNMIIGVSEGFKKQLEVIGVGFRANAVGQQIELSLGFSHSIILEVPSQVKLTTLTEKVKRHLLLSNLMTSNC